MSVLLTRKKIFLTPASEGLLESWSAHVSLSDLRSRFYEPWLRVFGSKQARLEFPVVDFLRGLIAEHFLDNDHIHSIMLEFHTPTALHAKTTCASPALGPCEKEE